MSESNLNKTTTLQLDGSWRPIGFKNGAEAIIAMTGGNKYAPPAMGISLEYLIRVDGTVDFETVVDLVQHKWDSWRYLPVRPYDFSVNTIHGKIRIPSVIIHPKFNKTVKQKKRYSKHGVAERDGYIDQYTGEKLSKRDMTVDHIIPLSRGGKTSWENTVITSSAINNKKGNKFNHEVGLKLIRIPKEPSPTSIYQEVAKRVDRHSLQHADWNYFLKNYK